MIVDNGVIFNFLIKSHEFWYKMPIHFTAATTVNARLSVI